MRNPYVLVSDFHKKVISRHQSVETATKAMDNYLRFVKLFNGPAAYLPMSIHKTRDDVGLDYDDIKALTNKLEPR